MNNYNSTKLTSKSILITLVLLGIGLTLLFYTYKDFDLHSIKKGLQDCYFHWIILAALAHLVNHALRAYRWRLLLQAQGESLPLTQVYLAEMSGFFINSIGLRLGEIVRCKSLQSMQKIPMNRSLATVVVERVADFLFFFLFLIVVSLVYFDRMTEIITTIFQPFKAFSRKSINLLKNPYTCTLFLIGSVLAVGLIFLLVQYFFGKKRNSKSVNFFKQLMASIKKTRKINNFSFWFITILIWLFYFLLEYYTLFAFQATEALTAQHGLFPAIYIFIVLNLSHLFPFGGNGLGVYHNLMPKALALFSVAKEPALIYAMITHGIQTFNALIFGGICFVFIFFFIQSKHNKRP